MTEQEGKMIRNYMGWDYSNDNKGRNPSTDWGWMMDLLHNLMIKDDLCYTISSKFVRIHDHLDFDIRNDNFSTSEGPLKAIYQLIIHYIKYKLPP